MTRLKYNQIKQYRIDMLKKQNGKCLLCEEKIELNEAVLDHCHKTGYIRGVLHRGCNCILSKVENNMKRNRVDEIRLEAIVKNLIKYRFEYKQEIHPTFKIKG